MRIIWILPVAACCALTVWGNEWKLVWSDEFEGEGLPNPAKWSYEEGFIRNRELQYYTKGFNHARGNGRGARTSVPDAEKAFHVYALEWTARRLDFFVDDRKYFTLENDGTGVDS